MAINRQNRIAHTGLDGIVHDLKSPFSTLRLFLKSLNSSSSTLRPMNDAIVACVDRQMQQAELILNNFYTHGITIHPTKCYLHAELDEIVANFRTLWVSKPIAISLRPFHICIEMDQVKMRRVFSNLLLNAGEAMPFEGKILLAAKSLAKGAAIYVCNTGSYIATDIRRHIFDPGYSKSSMHRGDGIGLSICREIGARHGGSIKCYSTRKYGTIFHVFIPYKPAKA